MNALIVKLHHNIKEEIAKKHLLNGQVTYKFYDSLLIRIWNLLGIYRKSGVYLNSHIHHFLTTDKKSTQMQTTTTKTKHSNLPNSRYILLSGRPKYATLEPGTFGLVAALAGYSTLATS